MLFAFYASFQDVRAKTPGQKHCYKKVCHRVKTIAETKALVGRSISVMASHYDSPFKDRFNRGVFTSSGTKFDADDPTAAASANFPDGTELLVWNPKNGRAAHVRVTDFGPFHTNRKLDLTRAAAEALGFAQAGVIKLHVTVLAPPPPDEPLYKINRKYRRVGGFVGVYREEELKSLASLLISQAKRRRHRPKPALVASSRGVHQSGRGGARQTEQLAVTPVQFKAEASRAKITSLRYVTLASETVPPSSHEVPKSAFSSSAASPRVALTSEAKAEAAVTPGATLATKHDHHQRTRGSVGDTAALNAKANDTAHDTAPGKTGHEDSTGGDLEKKIAAISSLETKTNNGNTDVGDARSRLPRDTSFKRAAVRVSRRFDGSSGVDGMGHKGRSMFWLDRENQSLLFLLAVLILTSTAFFAAYYSVSNSTVSVGQTNPLPRRGDPDHQNPYATVKIMAPSQESSGSSVLNGKSKKSYANTGDTLNGKDGRQAPLVVTVIKRGSKISGNLSTQDGVLVEGLIEGDCICCELTIAHGGVVEGRVKAKRAIIKGRVDGTVDVADLHVKNEALIKGEVRYKDLVLDHGATLEARCKRVASL